MSEKEVRKVCNSVSLATTQWKMAVAQGRCELKRFVFVFVFYDDPMEVGRGTRNP